MGLSASDFYRVRQEALLRIWRLAYPAVFERGLGSVAQFLFVKIVALLGTVSLAANAIALQVEALAFMPALGLGVAAATVAGQAIGAGQTHIAELSIRRSLFWSNVWMGATGILFLVFGPFLASLFTKTPDVVPLAGLAVQIAAIELVPLAFAIVLGSALRSAGDTRSPLYVTFICIIFCRLVVTYLFGITFGWGLAGVWLATAVDWTARAAGLWWIFRVGVWKSIHEKEKAMYAPR
jgi:putative MATE family efflux protein